MATKKYDVIVIGAGSGGLSVGLFMSKAGFSVLMVSKSDEDIGGDCLNDGCVPSKALIHVSRIAHKAKEAQHFGLQISGNIDIKKAIQYVYDRQEVIRDHENAAWLKAQGVEVALGKAHFINENSIEVAGETFTGKNIILATGSVPRKLNIPGVENIKYYDNESIFHLDELPQRLLVIGGGPIGLEMGQAVSRLGSKVTIVHNGENIMEHDDAAVTKILQQQLEKEGIEFILNTKAESFPSSTEALLKSKVGREVKVTFDAVFVAIGRELMLDTLRLDNAGIQVKSNKIIINEYLQTTNKNVYVCGDVAGDLQFSHAAEFHARIVLNNLFSPIKKKLNNDHMSWVTFTDPELATFGLSEKKLIEKGTAYERIEQSLEDEDRAVVDNYGWGKLVLFISPKSFFKKSRILGGTLVAPAAGEIIQELILANTEGLSIDSIFNKIYPYPVSSRMNQKLIVSIKEKELTDNIKKWLQRAYKIFG